MLRFLVFPLLRVLVLLRVVLCAPLRLRILALLENILRNRLCNLLPFASLFFTSPLKNKKPPCSLCRGFAGPLSADDA